MFLSGHAGIMAAYRGSVGEEARGRRRIGADGMAGKSDFSKTMRIDLIPGTPAAPVAGVRDRVVISQPTGEDLVPKAKASQWNVPDRRENCGF